MVHTSKTEQCFADLDPLLKRTSELLSKIKNEGILCNNFHPLPQPQQHFDRSVVQGNSSQQNPLDGDSKQLGIVNPLHSDINNAVLVNYHSHKNQNGYTVSENENISTIVKGVMPTTALSLDPVEYYLRNDRNLRDYAQKADKLSAELKQANDQIRKLEKCLLEKQSSIDELSAELDRKTALVNSLTTESATKDILLRQLDSTLGRLTRSWKEQEAKQNLALKLAKEAESRRTKELEEAKHQHQLAHSQWDEQLNSLKAEYRLERISLEEQLAQMTNKCKELDGFCETSSQTIETLENKIKEYEDDIKDYQTQLTEQQQASGLIMKKCVQLKENWQNQFKKYKDSIKRNYETKRDEIYKLKDEISAAIRKYENEFENYKKQVDSAAERKIQTQLLSFEQKIQETTAQAEENTRNKLREASERYREELDQLRQSAETELSRQMLETESRIEVERQRVQNAEKQSEHWRIRAREAEEARSALALQINELLQARCAEAMQVIQI
uniref:Uncharacterized protein n=1 Tax=Trichobilharzia regenti TaxID=157069 RepID=A0AA85IPS0_TRIRE|nr:unnamed protein product [Trichobilharzia regenti]